MNKLALSLLPLTLLVGCASQEAQVQNDLTYRVEWIGERPLIDNSNLTVTFGNDGRAYGSAGCNHWFSAYQKNDHQLSFTAPASTMMMCAPALMEQEQRFLQALSNVKTWDFGTNGDLRLWPAEGKAIRLWPDQR